VVTNFFTDRVKVDIIYQNSILNSPIKLMALFDISASTPVPTDVLLPQDRDKSIDGPESQSIPKLLASMDDKVLSQTVELGTAIRQFRERSTGQALISQLRRVAPTFQGQILDFNLDQKYVKLFLKEKPDSPDEITVPKVKEADIVYTKDKEEAKELDSTLTEASNRLLAVSLYLMEVLQALDDKSDEKLTESLFRALCLTASTTSMLEVERWLRPGDRSRVKDHSSRGDMPLVIQTVRRQSPTATDSRMRLRPVHDGGLGDDIMPIRKLAPSDNDRGYTPIYGQGNRGRSASRRAHPSVFTYRHGQSRGHFSSSYRGRDSKSSSATSRSRSPP
jgi:hypothetical protein